MTWLGWLWGGPAKSQHQQMQMEQTSYRGRRPSLASPGQQQLNKRGLTQPQQKLLIQMFGKEEGNRLMNNYTNLRDDEALVQIVQRVQRELQKMKTDTDLPSFWKDHLQSASNKIRDLEYLSEKLQVYRPIVAAYPVYKELGRLAKDLEVVIQKDDSAKKIMEKIILKLREKYPTDPSFRELQAVRQEPTKQLIQKIRQAKDKAADFRTRIAKLLTRVPKFAAQERAKRQMAQRGTKRATRLTGTGVNPDTASTTASVPAQAVGEQRDTGTQRGGGKPSAQPKRRSTYTTASVPGVMTGTQQPTNMTGGGGTPDTPQPGHVKRIVDAIQANKKRPLQPLIDSRALRAGDNQYLLQSPLPKPVQFVQQYGGYQKRQIKKAVMNPFLLL